MYVSFDAYAITASPKTSTIFRIKIRICVIPYHIKSRLNARANFWVCRNAHRREKRELLLTDGSKF